MTHPPKTIRRHLLVSALATAGLSVFHGGCSSSAPEPPAAEEPLGTTTQAATGSISFDSSCTSPPSSSPAPGVPTAQVPANVMRNVQISEAYMRIVGSSPAFRECMTNIMRGGSQFGLPGAQGPGGPYYACNGDPTPGDVGTVMSHVLSPNGTVISCDYTALGTSRGGSAGVGNIDSSGREVLAFGNELGAMAYPANCNYNPDGAPCIGDDTYRVSANILGHEIMHTHGYSHVSDYVWNLNNVNVGDRVGTPPDTHVLTLDDFCGVMPSATPGNAGIAPTMPTSTPTPGRHPTYGSGIPYEVGACVDLVLQWSQASGHLHDDCGASFPGLKLVDTMFSGTPTTVPTHCVADPYTGTPYPSTVPGNRAPIPPHAPQDASFFVPCRTTGTVVPHHSDANANPVHLERRLVGTSGPWTETTSYAAGYDYRECAESLYGKACSPASVVPSLCLPDPPRFEPIPWWKWVPFTGRSRVKGIAERLGGIMMAYGVPAAEASSFPELGKPSGDLAADLGALGVGLYNPDLGMVFVRGPSTGDLPPVHGTAFATTLAPDGTVHLVGFGGDGPNGTIAGKVYDAKIASDDKSVSADWSSAQLPTGRTHAAATTSEDGKQAFLFGGRTAKGASSELWSYDAGTGAFALVSAFAASARTDAAIAADASSLVVFGGQDAKGNMLSDLTIVDLATRKSRVVSTSLVGRAKAAIEIRGGLAYVYGGQSANGASETLDVVSLADGKVVSSTKIGVASSQGSGLAVQPDGWLTIVPGAVPKSSQLGGAFVGTPGQLTFVPEQP
jgi:Galactose oxidase, central domain